MNLLEAAKQALDALEDVQEMMNTSQWFNDRVTALRQAIEQAEKREWVGLTGEELAQFVIDTFGYPTRLASAIEAKLKEKNYD